LAAREEIENEFSFSARANQLSRKGIIGSEGRNWKRIFIFCPSEPIIPQGYNWQWATNKIKFLSGGLFKKFI